LEPIWNVPGWIATNPAGVWQVPESVTVSVAVQVEVFPARSVAVIVTAVEIRPEVVVVPAEGDCESVTAPPHESEATTPTVKSGTTAWQLLFAATVWFAAHVVITGPLVSVTVSVAAHCEVLPAASRAVIVTAVAPRETLAPAAGDCVSTTGEQLSLAATLAVKSGTTP
jgi:hypothetical protein